MPPSSSSPAGGAAAGALADRLGTFRRLFSELPKPPKHNPVADAIAKATALNEPSLASTLQGFASMPASTGILANPPLYETPVDCDGKQVGLKVRGFAIRGLVHEKDIVKRAVTPFDVVFTGLFARTPSAGERHWLSSVVDRAFSRAFGQKGKDVGSAGVSLEDLATFVASSPTSGPEASIQFAAVHRLARLRRAGRRAPGINDDRKPGSLLRDALRAHASNVAIGVASIRLARLLAAGDPRAARSAAAAVRRDVFGRSRARKDRSLALDAVYAALSGGTATPAVEDVLQGMGTIQTHHGSAGSNMVARYLASLHVPSVQEFFVGAGIAMDCDRHFGAIHDMSHFVTRVEGLASDALDAEIRKAVLSGGLPTFGHPEISAAGRSGSIEQDPRAAIYLEPLFRAIDDGSLVLDDGRRKRLAILQRIYRIAFVAGVVKPGREGEEPLRLTPNTDFGAWGVQEALGIPEVNRTFLTYVFRGFGWLMDAREQLQQKIVRPVIPPAPEIVPKPDGDDAIPKMIRDVHARLSSGDAFAPKR